MDTRLALLLVALTAGCGPSGDPDASVAEDAGPIAADARIDAGRDAGTDASGDLDAGPIGPDAELDASADAGDDLDGGDVDAAAPIDAGSDAPVDAGSDAPVDGGSDAPEDAGSDAPVDAGCTPTAHTSPPLHPTTATNMLAGGAAWTELSMSIDSDDTSYASSTPTSLGNLTALLTVAAFPNAIPDDAVIDGLEFRVDRSVSDTSSGIRDSLVQVVHPSDSTPVMLTAGGAWPVDHAVATYGGSTSTFGYPWAPANLRSSAFQFRIRGLSTGVTGAVVTARVHEITLVVHYTSCTP